jgi:tripartite-type tricarboxylate transporter receptor subunit TctC
MPVDYAKDVVPVGRLADLPAFVLAAAANFAPRTLAEFVAYARANPGKANHCSAGVGSYPHFDAVMFARRAGIEMVHVPMSGGAGPIITELLNGNIQFCVLNVATSAGHVREGRMRALAVISDTRLPEFPDVPTLAEAGYPGIGTIPGRACSRPPARRARSWRRCTARQTRRCAPRRCWSPSAARASARCRTPRSTRRRPGWRASSPPGGTPSRRRGSR